jgi:spore germination protein KA
LKETQEQNESEKNRNQNDSEDSQISHKESLNQAKSMQIQMQTESVEIQMQIEPNETESQSDNMTKETQKSDKTEESQKQRKSEGSQQQDESDDNKKKGDSEASQQESRADEDQKQRKSDETQKQSDSEAPKEESENQEQSESEQSVKQSGSDENQEQSDADESQSQPRPEKTQNKGKPKYLRRKKPKETQKQTESKGDEQQGESKDNNDKLTKTSSIEQCEAKMKEVFCNSIDIVVQSFETNKDKALLVYVDGLTDKDLIDRDIIRPLKTEHFDGNVGKVINTTFEETEDLAKLTKSVLGGFVALFYSNCGKAYLIEFRQYQMRSVEEPKAETVVRGPKEGFNENIRTNTSLIRRKIRNPQLVIENVTLGKQTNTAVELVYIKDIVNIDVLNTIKKHLDKINTDMILESGQIEQYIDNNTLSPVSGIGLTQKPDVAAARILEGRVAILIDGTPHALTIPELFVENLHTSEDYYNRTIYASILRVLRLIGLFITVMLPGLAVAIMSYNQEMIPSIFLSSIVSAMQKTPMTVAAEILVMTVMFELLKEAGTRLPQAIGSAISIVGSLIVGEAAVNAGIVSEPSVIIVAIAAVSSFIVPNLNEFILVYRGLFWLLGTMMGLIGISAAYVIMLTQLISTTSYGIPILSSFSKNEMKDSFIRFPLGRMRYRPSSIQKRNLKRKDI